jgi:hypothetical protein
LATEWSFLVGCVAAAPLAIGVEKGMRRWPGPAVFRLLAHLASYSAYFWGSVAFMKWRLGVGS